MLKIDACAAAKQKLFYHGFRAENLEQTAI